MGTVTTRARATGAQPLARGGRPASRGATRPSSAGGKTTASGTAARTTTTAPGAKRARVVEPGLTYAAVAKGASRTGGEPDSESAKKRTAKAAQKKDSRTREQASAPGISDQQKQRSEDTEADWESQLSEEERAEDAAAHEQIARAKATAAAQRAAEAKSTEVAALRAQLQTAEAAAAAAQAKVDALAKQPPSTRTQPQGAEEGPWKQAPRKTGKRARKEAASGADTQAIDVLDSDISGSSDGEADSARRHKKQAPRRVRQFAPGEVPEVTKDGERGLDVQAWINKVNDGLRRLRVHPESEEAVLLVKSRLSMGCSMYTFVETLPAEDAARRSWSSLQTALLRNFGRDSSLQQWQIAQQLQGLRLSDFRDILELWLRFQQLNGLLLQPLSPEQALPVFLMCLPRWVVAYLEQLPVGRPTTAEQAFITAREYINIKNPGYLGEATRQQTADRRRERSPRRSAANRPRWRPAERFPYDKERWGDRGGSSGRDRDRPRGREGDREGPRVACKNCGQGGHVFRNCKEPLKCFECGAVGHRGRDCPNPRGGKGDARDRFPAAAAAAGPGTSRQPPWSEPRRATVNGRQVLLTFQAGEEPDGDDTLELTNLLTSPVVDAAGNQGPGDRRRLVEIQGDWKGAAVKCVIDPGSQFTCVSPEFFTAAGGTLKDCVKFRGAGDGAQERKTRRVADVGQPGDCLLVAGVRTALTGVVVTEIAGYQVLLGVGWCDEHNAQLTFSRQGVRQVSFPTHSVQLRHDGALAEMPDSGTHWAAARGLQEMVLEAAQLAQEVSPAGSGLGGAAWPPTDRAAATKWAEREAAGTGPVTQRVGAGGSSEVPLSLFLQATEEWTQRVREGPEEPPTVGIDSIPSPLWQGLVEMTDDEWRQAVDRALAGSTGTEAQRQRARDILQRHRKAFAKNANVHQPMRAPPIRIPTRDDEPARSRDNHGHSAEQLAFLNAMVHRLLTLGIIEESRSLYNATPVIVKKGPPAGGRVLDDRGELMVEVLLKMYRFCNDFRKLNEKTTPIEADIPVIEQIMRELANSRTFSKFDCTSGYYQMAIHEDDRPKTAFKCQLGTFQYKVAPFGLRNLPAQFNAALAAILSDMYTFLQHYFDDLVLHTETVDEHLDHLEQVLQRCVDNNVFLNIAKTRILQAELEILGHKVSYNEVRLPEKAVAAVTELKPPTSVKTLQQFLGLVGYYRRYIEGFARIAAPLTALLRSDVKWRWGEDQQRAFATLRDALVQEPVLKMPILPGQANFKPFVVHTDASDTSIGAVLSQHDERDRERPCAYLSRQLSGAQQRYPVSDRECLAVVHAVSMWRPFLGEAPFTVVTDHAALTYLQSAQDLSGRLARWALVLQPLNMTIKHRPGKEHGNADGLSRLPRQLAGAEDPGTGQASTAGGAGASEAGGQAGPLSVSTRELEFVHPAAIPQEGDQGLVRSGQGGRERPEQMRQRTGASVLVLTRGQRARDDAPGGGEQQEAQRAAAERARGWPKALVWHEEPWLSTALHAALRDGLEAIGALTERHRSKVTADVGQYRATFAEGQAWPLTMSARRTVDGEEQWLTVPPPSQRLELVHKSHDLGHFGVDKTVQRIQAAGAWWVGMEADARTLVERCAACARDAAHRVVYHAAQSVPIPAGVWDRVHMDILDVYKARNGAQYVLLFVDALSKFPVAFALQTKEATEVARCLWQTITLFGAMTCLYSDNGGEFVNSVVDALAEQHGIQRHLITAYRPQANGQVERMNRVVLAVLRRVTAETPDLWPEWLDYVMLAIRTATSATTKLSPFQVMWGRHFHPLENYAIFDWSAWDAQETGLQEALARRVVQMKMTMEGTWRGAAAGAATRAADRQRRATDATLGKRVVAERLAPGTTVFVKTKSLAHKMQHRFDGPYVVVGNAAGSGGASAAGAHYVLQDTHGVVVADTFPRDHVFEVPQQRARLTLRQQQLYGAAEVQQAIHSLAAVQPGPFPMEEAAGDEKTWAVERIEGVRKRAGRSEVLVKWAGYDEREWTDERNFHADDLDQLKARWRRAEQKLKKRREQAAQQQA